MDKINDIINQLKQNKIVYIAQIDNPTAWSYVITLLMQTGAVSSPVIIIASAPLTAEQIFYNIKFWLEISPLKHNLDIYYSPNLSTILTNLNETKPTINIIDEHILEQKIIAPNLYQQSVLTINKNDDLNYQKLLRWLLENGFKSETKVWSSGDFARRGNIIDIFLPADKYPLRLELNHKQISTIYFFDILTQSKIKEINNITIPPATVPRGESTIKDYFSTNNILILREDIYNKLITNSNVPAVVWSDFKNNQTIDLEIEPLAWPTFELEQQQFLQQKSSAQWKIFAALDDCPSWLKKIDNIVFNKTNPFLRSFISSYLKTIIITPAEIPPTNQSSPSTTNWLTAFKPGDYVVHQDHGIAKFHQIVKRDFTGYPQEFFELHYAGGDKIFVPVDQAYRLSKYIGTAKPELHRLSGTNWHKLVSKTKAETMALAAELIEQQAQRQLVQTKPILSDHPWEEELAEDFPFPLTADQAQTWEDVKKDLRSNQPMDRLICGDVGFGKTEIALRAAFRLIMSGWQVALLCPTTILAEQHFHTYTKRLDKFGVKTAVLSRLTDKKEAQQIIKQIKQGEIDLIIGTHRLLSPDISFKKLGMLIIDEEQRFGVVAKEKIKKVKPYLHVLTLTATPIPRTLHLALGGVKSLSIISTAPAGRQAVDTFVGPYNFEQIISIIKQALEHNQQIFYLYNNVADINNKARQLKKALPDLSISVAHGQLPSRKLKQIMSDFSAGRTKLLLCSTIIENGLDLPQVNTLIVEVSNKFGLSQLYQIRGRIGRSTAKGKAYFFYHHLTDSAKQRLQILQNATAPGSGFVVARHDMEMRGVGNILGKKQHGHIKAVGLNLYLQLLNQAILSLKHNKNIEQFAEVAINLPLAFGIPDDVIANQLDKFSLYHQLSACRTQSELDKIIKAAFTESERKNETLNNLIKILALKIIARKLNILSISSSPPHFYLTIHYQSIAHDKIKKLVSINPNWRLGEDSIKIKQDHLGNNWLDELISELKQINE